MQPSKSFFKVGHGSVDEDPVFIREAADAYCQFWRPRYSREFIPKFLIQQWLRCITRGMVVGGFWVGGNAWHDESGPGEHANVKGIQRWIAWHIPTHFYREILSFISMRGNGIGPSLSHSINYIFDNSQSDISMMAPPHRSLCTVRDLRKEDLSSLTMLREWFHELFKSRYGASRDDIELYFHYPVRSRLAVLHLHACIGHKETGTLGKRSHSLDSVIRSIQETGDYNEHNKFSSYWLDKEPNGSLTQILAHEHPTLKHASLEIDLVIPCAPKDSDLLPMCISSLRRNCQQIRSVVVISSRPIAGADYDFWFDESQFPFTPEDLGSRWRYQQVLKLYAPFIIPGLLPHVLLMDADTVWHRRNLTFVGKQGAAYFSLSMEANDVNGYTDFYNEPIEGLGLRKPYLNKSAIVHHMVFQRHILAALFSKIKCRTGQPPWKLFSSGKPSEWELYHAFAIKHFPDDQVYRGLRFKVTGALEEALNPVDSTVDFFACHSHRRRGHIDLHEDGQYHH